MLSIPQPDFSVKFSVKCDLLQLPRRVAQTVVHQINQANEASEFELIAIEAGTSRSPACAQPVPFGFGSTGFGKVCLTPNKSIKAVYHFCSIGSVNTGTLLSSTILAACNCCIMPQELQGQFCQQASSLLNALFYLGLFANQVPVLREKCPPSNESLMSMLLAVNCIRKLSGLRTSYDNGAVYLFQEQTVTCASERSKLRISLS